MGAEHVTERDAGRLRSVVVPARTDTPILIITGPPGVGKTTTARILAERSVEAVHLESDAFFRFIRAGRVEPWKPESHAQNRIVMRIVGEAAAGYASAGYFTIVDGIVIPGWFFEPLRDALHGAGCRAAYAVLRAPLSVCLARARHRRHDPLGDPGVIEQLWRSFSDLGDLEKNVLDVGRKTPEAAADTLERWIADGLLVL